MDKNPWNNGSYSYKTEKFMKAGKNGCVCITLNVSSDYCFKLFYFRQPTEYKRDIVKEIIRPSAEFESASSFTGEPIEG